MSEKFHKVMFLFLIYFFFDTILDSNFIHLPVKKWTNRTIFGNFQ